MMLVQHRFRDSTLLKNKSNKEMMISFGWLVLNGNIDDETKMNRYHTGRFNWFPVFSACSADLQGFAKDP